MGLDRCLMMDRPPRCAAEGASVTRPTTLKDLRSGGWQSKPVKHELRDNFLRRPQATATDLFPGIVGYENTVIPEINIAVLAGHDMLFLGEKGQAKSRLMRSLVRFLDENIPYLDIPGCPVHEDPYKPITSAGKRTARRDTPEEQVPIAWWPRAERYAERLAPGTKFADVIGEIDPAKLAGGHQHVGRRRPALRPHPADAPRHLRHERDPRTRRTHPGRAVQHPRRAGRADPRLPDPVRPRRAGAVLAPTRRRTTAPAR